MKIPLPVRLDAEMFATASAGELDSELGSRFGGGMPCSVVWRVKTDESIAKKFSHRSTVTDLNDFVGIRIILSHIGQMSEASNIVKSWAQRRTLALYDFKDYFKNVAPNRYRAIHFDYRHMHHEIRNTWGVEVQITTYLQNFHGALSHQLLYRRDGNPQSSKLAAKLEELSDRLHQLDGETAGLVRGITIRDD